MVPEDNKTQARIRRGAAEGEVYKGESIDESSTSLETPQGQLPDFAAEQTQLISRLKDELRIANHRSEEASRKLDLLEREKAEIEAALDGALRSTGWRFLKQFRKLKTRFLPPGSYRRRLYDWVMIRFASSAPRVFRPSRSSQPEASSVPSPVPVNHADSNGVEQSQSAELFSCSIIIPVRNRSVFTTACLLAIEKSVSPERIAYEVIVVDNGSTDNTPSLLAAWSQSRKNVRVLSMRDNTGFAHACNEGAREARGRYIILLNNDTLPTPGWLEKMMKLATTEPQVGIVGGKLLFPDGRIQHVGVAFDEEKNPGHIYRGFPADIPPAKLAREYQAVTAACLMIDRKLYWSVNGLDEGYENSYEDIDLCLKVRAHGLRVLLCGDAVIYHFESISDDRRAYDFRNRALLKNRWAKNIVPDLKDWYARDGFSEDSTQFESHETYDPEQENCLKDLWRRVYSGPFPEEALSRSMFAK